MCFVREGRFVLCPCALHGILANPAPNTPKVCPLIGNPAEFSLRAVGALPLFCLYFVAKLSLLHLLVRERRQTLQVGDSAPALQALARFLLQLA